MLMQAIFNRGLLLFGLLRTIHFHTEHMLFDAILCLVMLPIAVRSIDMLCSVVLCNTMLSNSQLAFSNE